MGSGKIAQCLKVLVFPEDLGSVTSSYIVAHNPDLMLWPSWTPCKHLVCIYIIHLKTKCLYTENKIKTVKFTNITDKNYRYIPP